MAAVPSSLQNPGPATPVTLPAHSQGCGLVTMGSHEEAAAALEGLDNKFVWGGMGSPMSVRWMDAALQKRRRDAHVAAVRHDLLPPIRLTAAPLLSPQSLPLTRAGLQQGAALNTGLLRGLSGMRVCTGWRGVGVGGSGQGACVMQAACCDCACTLWSWQAVPDAVAGNSSEQKMLGAQLACA
jgi:hypothetical protein